MTSVSFIILNALIALTALILGLLLLLSKGRDRQRLLFAMLNIGSAIWVLSNYFGSNVIGPSTYPLIMTDYVSGVLLALLFWLFSRETKKKILKSKDKYNTLKLSIISSLVVIVVGLILSGYIVGVHVQNDLHISSQSFYLAYPITIFILVILGIKDLLITLVKSPKIEDKNQIKFIFTGLLAAVVCVTVPNLILENIFPKNSLLILSYNSAYIGILFFLVLSTYAIVKHRFLDIRYVVFRLTAYITSLAIIILLFTIIAFGLTSIVFYNQPIPIEIQLSYIGTAILIAISFTPIKNFVNKSTNQIFFQQSYSVHDSLSEISTFATRSVNATRIQHHTLEVFNKTIRPEYAGFIMFDFDGKLVQASNSGDYPLTELNLPDFLNALSKLHQKVTFPDDVSEVHKLSRYFELSRIGSVTRLSTSNKSIGYLILGEKKNGNTYSAHDLQLLTLAANDLALALQNAQRYEEIQQFNATLQNKINDATRALKRTNAKLVALDDAKDEFISMASHQLRTPLTSVKGYISMMLEGDLGKISATQRQALKEAFDSSQRMVFLISDFLNVSRIRTGKFTIETSQTDLAHIVEEEIGQLKDMAGLRNQKIEYIPPKTFPTINLDENKIRQVMMNMIDNAIFYTPQEGNIKIILEKTKEEIIFKVIDNGIGVPKEAQHRLFTKFFRAENARNARPDGTGLGLFMAQKIITAQGGKIIFQSEEGKGSTFGFRFPLRTISKNN